MSLSYLHTTSAFPNLLQTWILFCWTIGLYRISARVVLTDADNCIVFTRSKCQILSLISWRRIQFFEHRERSCRSLRPDGITIWLAKKRISRYKCSIIDTDIIQISIKATYKLFSHNMYIFNHNFYIVYF